MLVLSTQMRPSTQMSPQTDKESRLRTVVSGFPCLFQVSGPACALRLAEEADLLLKFYLGQSLGCFSVPVLLISSLTAGRDHYTGSLGGCMTKVEGCAAAAC